MAKATVNKDCDGRTFEMFKDEIIALAMQSTVQDFSAIYVVVNLAMTGKGKYVIGHFEEHYIWDDVSLNTELPDGAILVWTRDMHKA